MPPTRTSTVYRHTKRIGKNYHADVWRFRCYNRSLFCYRRIRGTAPQKMSKLTGNATLETLIERSTDDAYKKPCTPLTEKNIYERNVVKLINGSQVFMTDMGFIPNGDQPFLNRFDINTKTTKQLWRCEEPFYEAVTDVLDFDKRIILNNKQSLTEQPNYYLRD